MSPEPRSSQRDDSIQRILAPACAALLPTLSGMMHQDHQLAGAAKAEQPRLKAAPIIGLILPHASGERAQIVQQDNIG